ncbi:MAG: hypothetical protein O3A01_03050 [bacterium]|nr:hypothetical protein [bacterium]
MEAFAKSKGMDEKKNRFFKSVGSDSFLGRLGMGDWNKQAHNFTRQLRQMDSQYELDIAITESEAAASGSADKGAGDDIRMKRINMAMDVYTQSGESLSEENKKQLREMILGDGSHTHLVAGAFQNQFQNADASLDGTRAGSDQISRLEGLRSDLGEHAQKNSNIDFEQFGKDLAGVDQAFNERSIEHDGHDTKGIADDFKDLAANISASAFIDEKDKKRREQLAAEIQNLQSTLTVQRDEEGAELQSIGQTSALSDAGDSPGDDAGDASDEAKALAGGVGAAQLIQMADRGTDPSSEPVETPTRVEPSAAPVAINRDRVADSLNTALLLLLDGGVSDDKKASITSGVKKSINGNPTDRANLERDLIRMVRDTVSDPKRAQFARQLIRTTLRAVPADAAAQGVAKMSVIDARATYDEVGSKPGRIERSLAQAIHQNTQKPPSAMAAELGFENTVQEVGGLGADFADQTATALKGQDRDGDNAVVLSREAMMQRMARALPKDLQSAMSDTAIDEAVAMDGLNDLERMVAREAGMDVDPARLETGALVDLAHIAGQYEVVGSFLQDLQDNPSPDKVASDEKKEQVQAFAAIMASPAQKQILANVLSKLDDDQAANLLVKMMRMSEPSVLKAAGVRADTAALVQEFGGPLDTLNFIPDRDKAVSVMKASLSEMESVTGFHQGANPEFLGKNLAGFLEQNPQFVPATISEIRENGDFRILAFASDAASPDSDLKRAMVMALPSDIRAHFEGDIAPTIRELHHLSSSSTMPPEAVHAQLQIMKNTSDTLISGAKSFLMNASDADLASPAYKELEKHLDALKQLSRVASPAVIDVAMNDLVQTLERISPTESARIKGDAHVAAVDELAESMKTRIEGAKAGADRTNVIVGLMKEVNDARGLAFYSDDMREFSRVVASAAISAIKGTDAVDVATDPYAAQLVKDASSLLSITGTRTFKSGSMSADHFMNKTVDHIRGVAANPPGTQADIAKVIDSLSSMVSKGEKSETTDSIRAQLLRIKYSNAEPAVKLGQLQRVISDNKEALHELNDPKDPSFKSRADAGMDRLEGHLKDAMSQTLQNDDITAEVKAQMLVSADSKFSASLLSTLKSTDVKTYDKVMSAIQNLTTVKEGYTRSKVGNWNLSPGYKSWGGFFAASTTDKKTPFEHYEWKKNANGVLEPTLVRDKLQVNSLEARAAFELVAEVAKSDTDLAQSKWYRGEENFNKAATFYMQQLSRQAMAGKLNYAELKTQLAQTPGFSEFLSKNVRLKGAFDAYVASSAGTDLKEDAAALTRFLQALNSEVGEKFPSRTLLSGALIHTFVKHDNLSLGNSGQEDAKIAEIMQTLVNGIQDAQTRQSVLVEAIKPLSKDDRIHLLIGINQSTSSRNQDLLIAMMMVDPELTANQLAEFDSNKIKAYFSPQNGRPSVTQDALVKLFSQQKDMNPSAMIALVAQASRADSSILQVTVFAGDQSEQITLLKAASSDSVAELIEQLAASNDPALNQLLVSVSRANPDAITQIMTEPGLDLDVANRLTGAIFGNLSQMGKLDASVVKMVMEYAYNQLDLESLDAYFKGVASMRDPDSQQIIKPDELKVGGMFIYAFAAAIENNPAGALAFFNSERLDSDGEYARSTILNQLTPEHRNILLDETTRNFDVLNDLLGRISPEDEELIILNLITNHTTLLIDNFDKLDASAQSKVSERFMDGMNASPIAAEKGLQDKVNYLQSKFDSMPLVDRLSQRSQLVASNFQGDTDNRALYKEKSNLTLAQLRLAQIELKNLQDYGQLSGEASTPAEAMLKMNSNDRLKLLAVCCGVPKERLTRDTNSPAQTERGFVAQAIGIHMTQHLGNATQMAQAAKLTAAAIASPLFKGTSTTILNELTKVSNNMAVLKLAGNKGALTHHLKAMNEQQLTDLITGIDLRDMSLNDASVKALKTLVEASNVAKIDLEGTNKELNKRKIGQLNGIKTMAAQRGMVISLRLQQQDVANAHLNSLADAPIPVEGRKSFTDTLGEVTADAKLAENLQKSADRAQGSDMDEDSLTKTRLKRNDDLLLFLNHIVLTGKYNISSKDAINPKTGLVDVTRVSQIAVHESKVHAENMMAFQFGDRFTSMQNGLHLPFVPVPIPFVSMLWNKETLDPKLADQRNGLSRAEYMQMNRQTQSLLHHTKEVRRDADSFQHIGPADGKMFEMSDLNNKRGPAHNLPIMINNLRQRDVGLLESNIGEMTRFILGIEDKDEQQLYLKAISDEMDRQDKADDALDSHEMSALSNSNEAQFMTIEKIRGMAAIHTMAVNVDRTLRSNDPTYKGSAYAESLMHRSAVAVEKLIEGMVGKMAQTKPSSLPNSVSSGSEFIKAATSMIARDELATMPRHAKAETPYAVLQERQFYGDMSPQDAHILIGALTNDIPFNGVALLNDKGEIAEDVDINQLKDDHFNGLKAIMIPGEDGTPIRKYTDEQITVFKGSIQAIKDSVAESQENSFLPVVKKVLETSSGEMQRRVQTAMRVATKGTEYEATFLTIRDAMVFEAKAEEFAASVFSGSTTLSVYQKGVQEAVDLQNAKLAQLVAEIPEEKQARFVQQLAQTIEIQFKEQRGQLKGQKNKIVIAKMAAINAMMDKLALRQRTIEDVPSATPTAATGETVLAQNIEGQLNRSEGETRSVIDKDFDAARNGLATTMAKLLTQLPELPQSANDLKRMGAIMAKASFTNPDGSIDKKAQKEAFTLIRKSLGDRNFGDMAMHARSENPALGPLLDGVQQENLRSGFIVYDEAVESSVKYILTGMSQGRDDVLEKPSNWRGSTQTSGVQRKRMNEIMKNPHINDAQKMIIMERLMHTDMVLFAKALEDTGDDAYKWLSYFTSDGNRMRTFVEKFLTAGMSGASLAGHLGASFVNRFNPVKGWRDSLERSADRTGDGVQAIIRRKMNEFANMPAAKKALINADLKATFEDNQIKRTDMNMDIFPAQFMAMMHRHFSQSNEVALMVKDMGGVGVLMDNTELVNDPLLADFWREYLLTEYTKGNEVNRGYWNQVLSENADGKKGRYHHLVQYMDTFKNERGQHTKKHLNLIHKNAFELLMVIDARWDEIPADMALEKRATEDGPGLFEQLKAKPLSGVTGFENLDKMGKSVDKLTKDDQVRATQITGEMAALVDRTEPLGAKELERVEELKTELETLLKRAEGDDTDSKPVRDDAKIKEKRKHNLEFVRSILTKPSPTGYIENEDKLAVRADVIKYIASQRQDLFVALLQHIDDDPKLRPEQKQDEKHKLLLMTSEMMDYSGGARSVEGAKLKASLMQYVTHVSSDVLSKKDKAFINARLFTNTMREEGMLTQTKKDREGHRASQVLSAIMHGVARGIAFGVTAGTSEIIPRYIGHGTHMKMDVGRYSREYVSEEQRFDDFRMGFEPYQDDNGEWHVDDVDLMVDTFLEMEKVVGGETMDELVALQGRQLSENMTRALTTQLRFGSPLRLSLGEKENRNDMTNEEKVAVDKKVFTWAKNALSGLAKLQARWYESVDGDAAKTQEVIDTIGKTSTMIDQLYSHRLLAAAPTADQRLLDETKAEEPFTYEKPDIYGKVFVSSVANYQGVHIAAQLDKANSKEIFRATGLDAAKLEETIRTGQTLQSSSGHEPYRDSASKSLVRELRDIHSQFAGTTYYQEKPFEIDDFIFFLETINSQMEALGDQIMRRPIGISGYSPPGYKA